MACRPPSTSPFTAPILRRGLHTSPCLSARPAASQLAHQHANIPPYPYGISHWYKQSNFGLYGASRPQSGNTVSSRTETKNRRKWFPNIHSQRLWSDALDRFVRVKVQARVMRTIDKVGGLDEYLLGEKAGRVRELGMGGWALRWRLMRTEKVRERFRMQRVAMGLSEGGYEEAMKVEGGVVSEGEAVDRERAIDRILDKEAKREDAGVELGNPEVAQMGEVVKEGPRMTL
ncbi:39S ribosomal protein L24, mitochondrial [Xylographa opegraphella]|nr:39S ribosomal protein L24, mitochondrial [Xylographa opegraphella]